MLFVLFSKNDDHRGNRLRLDTRDLTERARALGLSLLLVGALFLG
jgi:hypothetical protein